MANDDSIVVIMASVISLQTLNEVLAAGDVDQARNAFHTQVSVSNVILSLTYVISQFNCWK